MSDDEILKFLYKRENQVEIDKYLAQATTGSRVKILEYSNFKDYDIIPLIKRMIIKTNRKVKK